MLWNVLFETAFLEAPCQKDFGFPYKLFELISTHCRIELPYGREAAGREKRKPRKNEKKWNANLRSIRETGVREAVKKRL